MPCLPRSAPAFLAVGAILAGAPPVCAQAPMPEQVLEAIRERVGDSSVDRPILHAQQRASVDLVYSRPTTSEHREALAIPPVEDAEISRFLAACEGVQSGALDLLDEYYGTRDDLKALAVRDSDGDGTPDYRVSDYYGKLSEGDVDVDGDGVRNLYDRAPYDSTRGGRDTDGNGIPDEGFEDADGDGLPDHVDWSMDGRDPELARLQLDLFRDHQILLVERDATFDRLLATAVDDAVRRVFRAPFKADPVLPTLRTVAAEETALLHGLLALLEEDHTSAQVFSQNQSLTVYDEGRAVDHALGLLGLLVHEMGHSFHMALDWDAAHPDLENRRTDLPAPRFGETVAPFGWSTDGFDDGRFEDVLPVMPLFLYSGMREPAFLLKGRTPEEWAGWLNAIYEETGESEDYLEHPAFAREGVVGDYSLSTPYEWYGDNLLAYVVTALEETAHQGIAAAGPAAEVEGRQRAATESLVLALRTIWPAFDHRNLSPEARAYFEATFPIITEDRQLLVDRYLVPIIGPTEDEEAFEAVEWGPKGLDIRSRDGNYHAHIDWRAQLRLTESVFGAEGLAPDPESREGRFAVNRARFKMGGHAYRPWLGYYLEFDFITPALLDLRFTLKASDAFQVRVGQWKFPYNRERVDSSGQQQFVERSIVTPFFTIDRQQGAALYGRLWKGRLADSWYNVAVNDATGRGGDGSAERPMVLGRWQWNVLKRDLPFSQSDFAYKKPAASMAVAGASWQGPYTAFSTQGGGELPGFPVGGDDRYKVEQAMVETAFQGRGFSWQQEYHWKRVEDTDTGRVTELEGYYLQAGYFFHALFEPFPRPLELAARWAEVDQDVAAEALSDRIRELTLAANWFFAGHRNKLTLDFSVLDREAADPSEQRERRLRLQWEVSF